MTQNHLIRQMQDLNYQQKLVNSFIIIGANNRSRIKKRTHSYVYNSLLSLCVLGKSYGFPSGSFSFTNLVLANATNHTQTRYRPLSNAYEVLKYQDLDKVNIKQLQFLLGTYYDDQFVAANTACHDLEQMFMNDWLPILKKNIVSQEFEKLVELHNYSELKTGGEIRNLLILNRDNWSGSKDTLKRVSGLKDKILEIINTELND